MMKLIVETPRFILREHAIEDATDLYFLNSDPEVIRYTGDPPFGSVADAERIIRERMFVQCERYGMSRWAVLDKSDRRYVGWCGLKYLEDEREVDLGYRFARAHWGRGIATETARASLAYGFETLGLQRIVAHAMTANTASIRVLEKVGMRRLGEIVMDGNPALQFEARRDDVR